MKRVNRLLPLPWSCVLVTGPEEPPVLCSHHLTMRAASRAREKAMRQHSRALGEVGWWFEARPRRDRRTLFEYLDDVARR